MTNSTAGEIVARVPISEIAQALGVRLDRTRRRCICPWRERADGWNITLDDSKGAWFDHARSEGGGVLDFIKLVRGCDRKAALLWLAEYAGVPLLQPTAAERNQWARRMRAAKPEAEALVQWKLDTLESLRCQRNRLMRIYHNAVRFVLRHDPEECAHRGDVRYELALGIGETYWPRVEELDVQIDRLEAATYADLLERFRGAA